MVGHYHLDSDLDRALALRGNIPLPWSATGYRRALDRFHAYAAMGTVAVSVLYRAALVLRGDGKADVDADCCSSCHRI
ncbi:hypothetical protein D3C72_2431610 [compost metagenome]